MARGRPSILLFVVSCLALASCTERAPYWTPEGTDATVAGRWTIAGAPADATTCGAAGISEVELVFVHDGADVDLGSFTFPCVQGGFDSRPGPALAAGAYDVHWLFLPTLDGGAGSLATPTSHVTATTGGHVDVPTGDYVAPPPDAG